jgi:hypothetical protein
LLDARACTRHRRVALRWEMAKILVVDDNEQVLTFVEMVLGGAGHEL